MRVESSDWNFVVCGRKKSEEGAKTCVGCLLIVWICMCFVVGFFFLGPFPYEEAFVLLSVKKVTSLFLLTRLLTHFFLSLSLSLSLFLFLSLFLSCFFFLLGSYYAHFILPSHFSSLLLWCFIVKKHIHFIFPFSFPLFYFFVVVFFCNNKVLIWFSFTFPLHCCCAIFIVK